MLPINIYEALIVNNNASVTNPFVVEDNLKTINGESLIGNTDIVISTGITIGTTPITSGVNNRILFQSGGVVQQSSRLTYDGSTMYVQASGALPTNKAFLVRNSANTANILQVLGNEVVQVGNVLNGNCVLSAHSISKIGVYGFGTTGVVAESNITGGGTRTGLSAFARSYGASSTSIGVDVVADGSGNGYGLRVLQGSYGTGINYGVFVNVYNGGTNYGIYVNQGHVFYNNNVNIVLGTGLGTKIGTSSTQKIGFWNATPQAQQVLSTGTGKTVDNVITFLQSLGLCRQI